MYGVASLSDVMLAIGYFYLAGTHKTKSIRLTIASLMVSPHDDAMLIDTDVQFTLHTEGDLNDLAMIW